VVYNHISFIEPIFVAALLRPSFVVRSESRSLPAVGAIMRGLQCIFVDRADPVSRHNVAAALSRRGRDTTFPPVAVAPEGTISNGHALLAFRGGAFAPGVPVQPVCVRYPHQHFDVCWSSEVDMPFHCWRLLSQVVAHMEVEYLPVHFPTKAEQADPILFANNVRQSMANALRVPVTEHSYDDVYFVCLS
jgi:lysophosphatidylcholine acyltransferase/lyso-PAF acetyltransferase